MYYIRSGNVYSRLIDGLFFVVDMADRDRVWQLNEVGSFLFGKLKTKRSFTDLVAVVVKNYEVEEVVARKDVGGFLREFVKLGLIEKFS